MAKSRKRTKNPITTNQGRVLYPERCNNRVAAKLMNERKLQTETGETKTSRIGTCHYTDAEYVFRFGSKGAQFSPRVRDGRAKHKIVVGKRVITTMNGKPLMGTVTKVTGKIATVAWDTGATQGIQTFALRPTNKGKSGKPAKAAKTAKAASKPKAATKRKPKATAKPKAKHSAAKPAAKSKPARKPKTSTPVVFKKDQLVSAFVPKKGISGGRTYHGVVVTAGKGRVKIKLEGGGFITAEHKHVQSREPKASKGARKNPHKPKTTRKSKPSAKHVKSWLHPWNN